MNTAIEEFVLVVLAYIIYGINGAVALVPILLPAVICYWYGYEKGKANGFERK